MIDLLLTVPKRLRIKLTVSRTLVRDPLCSNIFPCKPLLHGCFLDEQCLHALSDQLQRPAEEAVEVGGQGLFLAHSLLDRLLGGGALVSEIDEG